MLDINYVTEQGQRFFPITHRSAIVGLSTNTLVLSESVDIDVDINADGEPITINPIVQQELNNLNNHCVNIDNSITNINETLKVKADSDTNGTAYTAHKFKTPRNIAIDGAVTGNVNFDGSANVTITTAVNHTHSYAGSATVAGAATSALKWTTPRNIKLQGVVVGNVNWDGSGNAVMNTTFGTGSTYLPISGGTLTGGLTVNGNINCQSRYYQQGTAGQLVAAQSGGPNGNMIWAW